MKFLKQLDEPRNWYVFGAVVIFIGVVFRFYNLPGSGFVYYDEGLYLNHNRAFAKYIALVPQMNFPDKCKLVYYFITNSLASGKGLWFILADIRMFFGGLQAWWIPKLLSAVLGSLTVGMTYLFAKRFFNSRAVGMLAAVLLAVLPSHVFYSRIGMQEALSTLLILSAFYFYIFPKQVGWKTFFAGVLFGAAFFSNYRLIIAPVLIGFCELYLSLAEKRKPDIRRFVWCVLIFACCVFGVGNLEQGQNTKIIFAWIFHQANLAEGDFDVINFFAYPYYLFRLESWPFALAFFGSLWLIVKRKWRELFPFAIACLQMGIFSLTSEKGARYLCVMMPFMVMASGYVFLELIKVVKNQNVRIWAQGLVGATIFGLMMKSATIAAIHSDYKPATEFLLAKDQQAKFISTQYNVQNLYVPNPAQIQDAPHSFEAMVSRYSDGYKYLVICPQAYISWGEDDERFAAELEGYMGFITKAVRPVKEFEHFSPAMMERFVFEHTANLRQSIKFLKIARKENLNKIRVYDLAPTVNNILRALVIQNKGG